MAMTSLKFDFLAPVCSGTCVHPLSTSSKTLNESSLAVGESQADSGMKPAADDLQMQMLQYGRGEQPSETGNANSHASNNNAFRPRSGFFVSLKLAVLLLLGLILVLVAVAWLVALTSRPGPLTLLCQCGSASSAGNTLSNRSTPANLSDCLRDWGHCMLSDRCSRTSTPTAVLPVMPVDVRLPRNLLPVHYDLELRPDLYGNDTAAFSFDGRVHIWLSCIKAANQLMVHANALKVSEVAFVDASAPQNPIRVISSVYSDTLQYFTFTFDRLTEPGHQYKLSASFQGPLKPDMVGLYLSSYEMDGQLNYLATTQFQATDARKAFPCLDEPDLKATFNVTLVRKRPMISISNMPLLRSDNRANDWVADVYQKTVVMPTYLLAFIVCNFLNKQTFDSKGRSYRIFARPNAISQTNYSAEISPRILEYFEEYFNISYVLPKIDMIAIPDFSAGAMENWGLVTYRENTLLFDPLMDASIRSKQRVAIVVAHEIAHQWFGNLVTMAWWDDLWLNEGFASYVEYLGVNKIYPEWEMNQVFIMEDLHDVMKLDSLQTSHPIYVQVKKPEEISEIFDKISYGKGASICRMVNFILSEGTFKRGLKRYLERHRFGNAHHTALWRALTEQAQEEKMNINVTTVMHNWTVAMGYPVVTLLRSGDQILVNQEHFLLDRGIDNMTSVSKTLWHVPLTFVSNESATIDWDYQPIIWLSDQQMRLTSQHNIPRSNRNWIIANVREYGYYRVNYDNNNWNLLIDQLQVDHRKIDVFNRAQIVDDAFNLARAGLLNYISALNITKYLRNEREYTPWQTTFVNLDHIDAMLSKTFYYGHFRKYMLGQIQPIYNDLGWEERPNDTVLTGYLRTSIMNKACSYGLEACVSKAQQLFRQWRNRTDNNNNSPVNANLRAVMLCTGIRNGNWDDWLWLYQRFKTTNIATERTTFLVALACTREIWILQQFLEKALDPKEIRPQDLGTVMIEVARNPVGRYLTYDFVKQHGHRLQSIGAFSHWPGYLYTIAQYANKFHEMQDLRYMQQRLRTFGSSADRAIEQALETIYANMQWMANYNETINAWLKENVDMSISNSR